MSEKKPAESWSPARVRVFRIIVWALLFLIVMGTLAGLVVVVVF